MLWNATQGAEALFAGGNSKWERGWKRAPIFLSLMETMESQSNAKMFLIFVFQVVFVAVVDSTQIKGVPASSKYDFESTRRRTL